MLMSVLFTLLFIFNVAQAKSNAELIYCNDGDTCRISVNGNVLKVRLHGIDAPENGYFGYLESKEYLIKILKNKKLTLRCNGKSYDRETCEIFTGSTDIQKEMVKAGHAIDSPKYSGGKYKKEQDYAKSKKLGVWADTNMTSPHCQRWPGTQPCNLNAMYQP